MQHLDCEQLRRKLISMHLFVLFVSLLADEGDELSRARERERMKMAMVTQALPSLVVAGQWVSAHEDE